MPCEGCHRAGGKVMRAMQSFSHSPLQWAADVKFLPSLLTLCSAPPGSFDVNIQKSAAAYVLMCVVVSARSHARASATSRTSSRCAVNTHPRVFAVLTVSRQACWTPLPNTVPVVQLIGPMRGTKPMPIDHVQRCTA